MSDKSLQPYDDSNWRTRTLLAGGVLGSLLGVLAAYMFVRAADESSEDGEPKQLQTGDVFKLGATLLAIVRQIADLGRQK